MSILDLTNYNVPEAEEPTAAEAGEYEIRIIECDGVRENEAGNPYILPRFEIPSEPTSKDFTKYMALPHDDMDPKKLARTLATLKNFGAAFGIDFSRQIEFDELPGLTGWVILGVENSDEYGDQNYIKRFITGA